MSDDKDVWAVCDCGQSQTIAADEDGCCMVCGLDPILCTDRHSSDMAFEALVELDRLRDEIDRLRAEVAAARAEGLAEGRAEGVAEAAAHFCATDMTFGSADSLSVLGGQIIVWPSGCDSEPLADLIARLTAQDAADATA